MMLDSNWRPEKGWVNPYFVEIKLGEVREAYNKYPEFSVFEAGASAIIPHVREAVLKEVGEWLCNHLTTQLPSYGSYRMIFLPNEEFVALREGKLPGEKG